ncbi:hypothetical protein ACLKA7_006994 [Drosophila subpalustris]
MRTLEVVAAQPLTAPHKSDIFRSQQRSQIPSEWVSLLTRLQRGQQFQFQFEPKRHSHSAMSFKMPSLDLILSASEFYCINTNSLRANENRNSEAAVDHLTIWLGCECEDAMSCNVLACPAAVAAAAKC